MKAEALWKEFITKKTEFKNARYEAWSYGEVPDKLALLTVNGIKKATASGYDLYAVDGAPLPEVGELSIVLDGNGDAVCIIQTTNVAVVPFNEVSAEFACREGEGDRSLAYWRNVHKSFFKEDFTEAGLEFSETSLVVCEEFEVVFKAVDLDMIEAFVNEKIGADTTGHDLNHIHRVDKLAAALAEQEQMMAAATTVIRAAVLLHDVIDDKVVENVEAAKQEVAAILKEYVLSTEDRAIIWDTIENMSYSKNLAEKYELTPIGKIVQDADRLDAIGAIGIARTFYYGGSKGHAMYDETEPFNPEQMDEAAYRTSTNVVNHFHEKLLRLEGLMNTKAGKTMARERTAFMEQFLEQLDLEIKGER